MVSLGGDAGILVTPHLQYLSHAIDPDNPTPDEINIAYLQATDKYLGIQLVRWSDPTHFRALLANMKNDFCRRL
jgi:hypothetical protein